MPQFDLDNYVSVAERVQKFRIDHPDRGLLTELIVDDGKRVVMKATIFHEAGYPMATGHAEEVRDSGPVNRTSAVENAETSAWGRALANLGLHVNRSLASRDEMRQAQERAERQKEPTRSQILKKRIDDLTAEGRAALGAWCDSRESTRVTAQMTEAQLSATEEWCDNWEDEAAHAAAVAAGSDEKPPYHDAPPPVAEEPQTGLQPHQPDRFAAASSWVNSMDKTTLVAALTDYQVEVPRTFDAQKRLLVETLCADSSWTPMEQEKLI